MNGPTKTVKKKTTNYLEIWQFFSMSHFEEKSLLFFSLDSKSEVELNLLISCTLT
jgi:hypothetical protein